MTERHITYTAFARSGVALLALSVHGLAAADAGCGDAAAATSAPASLEVQFRDPPASARPRVWWHWMNGNVSPEGIAKDLAWMKRIGLAGAQTFNISLMTPKVVAKPFSYMGPEWKDALRLATQLADKEGLEFGIATSAGWSETGGPSVPPQDAMKKLVWSETRLRGGKRFQGQLAPLPVTTGPFQDLPLTGGFGAMGGPKQTFGAGAAVLAWRSPATEPEPAGATVTTGAGQPLDSALLGGSPGQRGLDLPYDAAGAAIVQRAYPAPRTIRSATVLLPGAGADFGAPTVAARLEAQGPGGWTKVVDFPLSAVPTTASFAPVTAHAFRLVVTRTGNADLVSSLSATAPGAAAIFPPAPPAKSVRLAQFSLASQPRIDAFELKAGFAVAPDYYALDRGLAGDQSGIDPASVVNLTDRVGPDGQLDWTPPPGDWTVLRLGYSLTGATNHPAPAEATGLEVDKYDGKAVRRYFDGYLSSLAAITGPALIGKRGLCTLVADSTEVGSSNWTPSLPAQFKRLRGYDLTPWLPALTGVIVGTRAQSDRFLYDYRRTLAELHASQHYGTMAEAAHERGLAVYGEALEDHRPSLGDDMAMRSPTDVPMSAFWTYPIERGPRPTYIADVKGAASVAHIQGQNLVGAEALTSSMAPWAYAPADLRPMIDHAFALGVNRPMIQSSVHQPLDDKQPGMTLFIFGQYFNRLESWGEMAKPWVDYIARNSLLLQQGRNVADVAYFYGEEAPLTGLYGDKPVADAPVRYAFDFANADAVLTAFTAEGNEIVTPGGARYRALYLGGSSRRMTLPLLRKLARLAEDGATIVGLAPEGSPALTDDPTEYAALVRKLWGGGAETAVGKGRVLASSDLEAALGRLGVAPDVSFAGPDPAEIPFVHRQLADGDSYFLVNRTGRAQTIEARFRVSGKSPELWHADTGQAEPASYRMDGATTVVPLTIAAGESVHVLFRGAATQPERRIDTPVPVRVGNLAGPWTVSFQPGRGAPPSMAMERLAPLEQQADPGVRYFSGEATYQTVFTVPRGWKHGRPLWLDLGTVHEVAEVTVNGLPAGALWHAPWRVDIGPLLRPGRNRLAVKVANLWVNRLIGDAQPGARKITWTPLPTYRADAPLRPSGLVGPVELLTPETR